MTPDLIAQVLALPLPVRLALLDADPNGAGWIMRSLGLDTAPSLTTLDANARNKMVRVAISLGAAWLPCNPLAIVEHVARLLRGEGSLRCGIDHDAGDYIAWVGSLVGADLKSTDGPCPHTAAVALLREVVGG